MTLRLFRSIVTISIALFLGHNAFPQSPEPSPEEAVRVKVTINADGSRTTYEVDNEHHTATATTIEPDGPTRGKIRYELDEAGRYKTGMVFGPDETFRFKSIYKYDTAGRLEQETHLGKDDAVINKIVYKYDAAGRPTGYVVLDASEKLVSGVGTPTPTPTATVRKNRNALGR